MTTNETHFTPRRPRVRVRGAARYLGVSPATVSRLMSRGEIPFYRVGERIVQFDLDELDDWLESRRVAPIPARRIRTMDAAVISTGAGSDR